MKKLLYLLMSCTLLCGMMTLTGCNNNTAGAGGSAEGQSSAEAEKVSVEEGIIGTWMLSEQNGKPALTDEKGLLDIVSATEAYVSISNTSGKEPWIDRMKSDVEINGNVVTIAFTPHEGVSVELELDINEISPDEFSADHKYFRTTKNSGTVETNSTVKYVKVNDDFSKDILGTWEGHCISENSAYDDGQDHRWEYKEGGDFVYYVKNDDDQWIPSADQHNEYFVAGNLLCTRWFDAGTEYREWWEITMDGDKMKWTALRGNDDGTTANVGFEMTRVKE